MHAVGGRARQSQPSRAIQMPAAEAACVGVRAGGWEAGGLVGIGGRQRCSARVLSAPPEVVRLAAHVQGSPFQATRTGQLYASFLCRTSSILGSSLPCS